MIPILKLAAICASLAVPLSAAEPSDDFHKDLKKAAAFIKEGKNSEAADLLSDLQMPAGLGDREKSNDEHNLAGLFNDLGMTQEYLSHLRAAVAADPGDLAGVRALAAALFYKGRPREALIYADYLCLDDSLDSTKEERAGDLIERGRIELALDRDERAEEDLKTALKLSPDNVVGLRTMAGYWLKRGFPAKGLSSADRLVDQARAGAPADRVAAYLFRANLRTEAKDYRKAESDIREALRADAHDAPARRALALCLVQQGRDPEAVEFFSGAELAQLQFRLGDNAKAAAVLDGILKAEPANLAALEAMAQGLSAQNRWSDALTYADRAVVAAQALPAETRARQYFNRGVLSLSLERFEDAQKDLQKSIADNPRATEPRFQLAVAFERQAKLGEALMTLDGAIAISSSSARDSAGLLTARYAIALESGDKTEAEINLKHALKFDAKQTCLATPSFVKRSEMDLEFFDACLGELPRESGLWADRGVARYLKGQSEGAVEDLAAALKLKPDSLEAAMSLASILQESQQLEKARNVVTKALAAADKRKAEPLYLSALAVQAALSPRK